MKITVNGEATETQCNTLTELLDELEIVKDRVAVELNLKVISKANLGEVNLSPGDQIEIVNFVGGG